MEKRGLIDDLKEAVIQGSKGKVKSFERLNANSAGEVLDLLISVGNVAYTQGEIDVFDYFIGSLFDIVNSDADVNSEELLDSILHFGVMSTHGHDIYSYSIILENFVDYLLSLGDMEEIDSNLKILKKLALESERKGFDSGVLQVVAAMRDIADHFEKEGMLLSRFFIKNHLISMISAVDRSNNIGLRDEMVEETRKVLEFEVATPITNTEASIDQPSQEAPPKAPSE